jgi:hypothetical protein
VQKEKRELRMKVCESEKTIDIDTAIDTTMTPSASCEYHYGAESADREKRENQE